MSDVSEEDGARPAEPRLIHQGELTIRIEDQAGTSVLSVYGELDLSNSEVFESAVRSAEERHRANLIVDLSGLQFIDSSGLAVLIRTANRSRENSNSLALLRGSAPVDRLFKLTGLTEHLPFAD